MLELDSIEALGLPSLLGFKLSLGKRGGIRGERDRDAVPNEVTPERRGTVGVAAGRSQARLCPTAWGLCAWAQEGPSQQRTGSIQKTDAAIKAAPSPRGPWGRLLRQAADPMRSQTRNILVPQI